MDTPPPIDPHGRTEREGEGTATGEPDGKNPLGARPVSLGGPEAQRARDRFMKALFPDEQVSAEPLMIGPYVVQEHIGVGGLIGQGGMGRVYAVRHPGLERVCVAKLLRGIASGAETERMQREACIVARFDHPNIVKVFDSGLTDQGEFYIIMEFIEGSTVHTWQGEPRSWRGIVEVYLQAGRGLAEAHKAGIVHRDFKPANVMVCAGGGRQVRVLDFGLAAPARTPGSVTPGARMSHPQTPPGARMGTTGYIPPEQSQGLPADARSDQFSFCVSLYEALFRRLPFGPLSQRSRDEVARKAVEAYEQRAERGEFDVPTSAGKPGRLFRRILRRGLAPRPEDRFPSMTTLLAELERELHRGERIQRRVFACGVALTGGVLGWFVPQQIAAARNNCLAPVADLTHVWNDERADQLRGALPDPLPASTAVRRLDAFKREWSALRVRACDAAAQIGGAEAMQPTLACLDDHLGVFSSVVEGLLGGAADPTQVTLYELPDAARLAACSATRQPATARRGVIEYAEAALARRLLTRAEAALILGEYTTGREFAVTALHAAQAAGDEPLRARSLTQLGRADAYSLGRRHAVARLEEAATLGERHGLPDLLADIYLRRLGFAAYGTAPNAGEANAFWSQLRSKLEQLDEATGLRTFYGLHARAILANTEGRTVEAAELLQQILALPGPHGPGEAARIAELRGLFAYRKREDEMAAKHFSEALELLTQEFGGEHPKLLTTLGNLALSQLRRGATDAAAEPLKQALPLLERPHDPMDALLIYVAATDLAAKTGRTAEGIALADRALATLDALALGDAARTRELELADNLLVLYYMAGDREGVSRMGRRAVDLMPLSHTALGTHVDWVVSRAGIAASELTDHSLAIHLLSGVLPNATMFTTDDVADHHVSLARTRLALGQPAGALAAADTVLSLPQVPEKVKQEARTLRSAAIAGLPRR